MSGGISWGKQQQTGRGVGFNPEPNLYFTTDLTSEQAVVCRKNRRGSVTASGSESPSAAHNQEGRKEVVVEDVRGQRSFATAADRHTPGCNYRGPPRLSPSARVRFGGPAEPPAEWHVGQFWNRRKVGTLLGEQWVISPAHPLLPGAPQSGELISRGIFMLFHVMGRHPLVSPLLTQRCVQEIILCTSLRALLVL